jgi:membrane protein
VSRLATAKASASQRWAAALKRWPWLAHAVRAWGRFQANNGTQFSAAITYFSFLALFPLLLLAVAVTGFVLHSDLHLQTELFNHITSQIPGDFGQTLSKSIKSAIAARTGVGIIGLVGVLLTGLGWISNLRQAIDAVRGVAPRKRNFAITKLSNLAVLVGLGLGVIVSLGLTVLGTSLTDQILRAVDIGTTGAMRYLVKVLGIALAVLGDMVIFGWLLVRLPAAPVRAKVAFRGALLASVGFEVLKVVGSYTIAKSAHSPTLGPFAGLLAVLIWIQLVSRYLLFCAAWIATAELEPVTEPADVRDPAGEDDRPDASLPAVLSPAGVAVSLLAIGAAAGAGATSWLRRRR